MQNNIVLEQNVSGTINISPVRSLRFTFQDIEHTIQKFNGEDKGYDIKDFYRNYGRMMEMEEADDLLKYTSLCNTLTETAKLFLHRGIGNYADLKSLLLN